MRKTTRIRGLMVPKNRAAGLGVASCHIGSDVSFLALYVLILDMCNHSGADLDIRKPFTSLREFRSVSLSYDTTRAVAQVRRSVAKFNSQR